MLLGLHYGARHPHLGMGAAQLPRLLANHCASAAATLIFQAWRRRGQRRAAAAAAAVAAAALQRRALEKAAAGADAADGSAASSSGAAGVVGDGTRGAGCVADAAAAVHVVEAAEEGPQPAYAQVASAAAAKQPLAGPKGNAAVAKPAAATAAADAAALPGTHTPEAAAAVPKAAPRVKAAPVGCVLTRRHLRPSISPTSFASSIPTSAPTTTPRRASAAASAAATAAAAAAAAAAAGHVAAAAPLLLPPYSPRTRLAIMRIKLSGVEPEQLPGGYEARVAAVLAARGVSCEGVYVRRGCIEVVSVWLRTCVCARGREMVPCADGPGRGEAEGRRGSMKGVLCHAVSWRHSCTFSLLLRRHVMCCRVSTLRTEPYAASGHSTRRRLLTLHSVALHDAGD